MSLVTENIKQIRANIEKACASCGRNPEEILLLGVSKTIECARIKEAVDAGITTLGENRVQELLEKQDVLHSYGVDFHLIGHLQTNKVKYIIDKVDMIESVDSFRLLKEIDAYAKKQGKVMDCLVELNIEKEESKFGLLPEELEEFLFQASALEHISIKGLMSIPPVFTDEKTQRARFYKLYQIFVDIKGKKIDNISMDYLSMGMSLDYYYAILEGANIVRVGTALFGKR